MSEDAGVRKPGWFDGKISLGNLVSWGVMLCGIVATFVWTQADVKALQSFRQSTETEIQRLKDQRQLDRENLIEMKADIRVIRHLLEQQSRPEPARQK